MYFFAENFKTRSGELRFKRLKLRLQISFVNASVNSTIVSARGKSSLWTALDPFIITAFVFRLIFVFSLTFLDWKGGKVWPELAWL